MFTIKKLKSLFITMIWSLNCLTSFMRSIYKNIPRNKNRYADYIACATSIAPIEINDEETILIIKKLGKSLCHFSYVE